MSLRGVPHRIVILIFIGRWSCCRQNADIEDPDIDEQFVEIQNIEEKDMEIEKRGPQCGQEKIEDDDLIYQY